ncbi:MAG TPA: hypothetical protein GX519_03955 [Thermoanaerobacterales bacterium]|nr:hypothetical protein [Thermoanaerobacterales bacterium]
MARKKIMTKLPPRIVRIVFQDVEVLNVAKMKSSQTHSGIEKYNTAISHSDFVGS